MSHAPPVEPFYWLIADASILAMMRVSVAAEPLAQLAIVSSTTHASIRAPTTLGLVQIETRFESSDDTQGGGGDQEHWRRRLSGAAER